MGYTLIYFIVAFIMALTGGMMLYFSWRYVEQQWVTRRTLGIALVSGFIFGFGVLVLVLWTEFARNFAIHWFGANGFYMAIVMAMIGALLHHRVLVFLATK